jgi:hypothetical protein
LKEDQRFCENCGRAVGETTNFCPNCGAAQRPDMEVPTGPPPPIPEAGRISTPDVDVPPPPQPPPEKSKGFPAKSVIITLICLILIVLFLGAVLDVGDGSSEKASGRTFNKGNYAELATDPNSFKGANVSIEGGLLKSPEVRDKRASFQMWADPKNHEFNTVVHTDSTPSGLSSDDTVLVTGKVKGAFEGENLFGATVKAVEVEADSVKITKSKSR